MIGYDCDFRHEQQAVARKGIFQRTSALQIHVDQRHPKYIFGCVMTKESRPFDTMELKGDEPKEQCRQAQEMMATLRCAAYLYLVLQTWGFVAEGPARARIEK